MFDAICGPAATGNPISTCSFPNSQSLFVQITDDITQPFLHQLEERWLYFFTLLEKTVAGLSPRVRTYLINVILPFCLNGRKSEPPAKRLRLTPT